MYLIAAVAIVIYNIFLVGDVLYSTEYMLRESMVINGVIRMDIVRKIILQLVLCLLPFVFIVFLCHKKPEVFYRILFTWIVAYCLSVNIMQAKADYLTVSCYGGKGTERTLRFLRKIKNEGKSILAPQDIYYNIDETAFMSNPDDRFTSKDYSVVKEFMGVIKVKEPYCIVTSISSNTVSQYQRIFNNEQVKNFLNTKYDLKNIGSYNLWLRKES